MARLNVYSRSKSCCLALASRARRFASVDKRLAMSEVARKLNKSDPISRVVNRELPDGLEEKKVESERGRNRSQRRFVETPNTVNDQNEHQVGKTLRYGI